MQSTPAAKPRQPRTFKVVCRPTRDESGVLHVTVGRKTTSYHFDLFRVDPSMGRLGVRLSKGMDDAPYDLLLGPDGSCTCDCMGHSRHGHCKHADLAPKLAEVLGV